jgi:hypothetical protein
LIVVFFLLLLLPLPFSFYLLPFSFIMTLDFANYAYWSGILTIFFFILALAGFLFKWGVRFRLVGITGFMMVLTAGLFALGLGLFTRQQIPGAARFSLVYDNGGNQAVITVKAPVSESEIEATLLQASRDLYSYGRVDSEGNDKLTIRVRTLIHPQPGLTKPVYLGQVTRPLSDRSEEQIKIELFSKNFAQLPKG